MAGAAVAVALIGLALTACAPAARGPAADGPSEAAPQPGLFAAGMSFEPNRGQTSPPTEFLTRGPGFTAFLRATSAVLALEEPASRGDDLDGRRAGRQESVAMQVVGADTGATLGGVAPLPGTVSYLRGRDPGGWLAGLPTYARVKADEVYPGIDLEYYGNQGRLEYDFTVHPGADPGTIRLRFDGADRMTIDGRGDMVLHTALGELRQERPVAHQVVDGARREVDAAYRIGPDGIVEFRVGTYEPRRPLVIDPILTFATYLGGASEDHGQGIVLGADGSIYVTGDTSSTAFPGVAGSAQSTFGGNRDTFAAKLSANGTTLLYATYLGGSGEETARGIDVNAAGEAFVVGGTQSTDYPTTPGSFQPVSAGNTDAYVTKLNASGTAMVYSTLFGGGNNEGRTNVAVGPDGSAYLSGFTFSNEGSFPLLNAIQTKQGGKADVFAAKLNPAGSALVYSTYLGGTDNDTGRGIDIDAGGNAYIAGWTYSTNFPTLNATQPAQAGGGDTIVAKLSPSGGLLYSTYLGGSGTDFPYHGSCLSLDGAGNVYVIGYTQSTDFPVMNAAQATYGGAQDAYVFKLDAAGSLSYATYLGGSGEDEGVSLDTDSAGTVFATGSTYSTNFPVLNPIQATKGRFKDGFVTSLNPAGGLAYSTYLGGDGDDIGNGIALGSGNVAHVVGHSDSSDLPITAGAYQATRAGSKDVFVAKIAPGGGTPTFGISDVSVLEGAAGTTTTASFTVSLSPAAGGPVSVTYATSNGTASAPADYLSAGGTVGFPPGETSKVVTVTVNGDGATEATEQFTVALSDPTGGAAIGDGTGVGTIVDDDGPPPPSLSINDVSVNEGAAATTTTAAFTVGLSAASTGTVTVAYATADGTATAPSDYNVKSGTLTLLPGQTSGTIDVTVKGDAMVEPTEQFMVVLSSPSGATIGDGTGVGTIVDDDTGPAVTVSIGDAMVTEGNSGDKNMVFTVTLSAATTSTVKVSFATANGTAVAPGDYAGVSGNVRFNPGVTTATITIKVKGDTQVEGNEAFTVTLLTASGATIADGTGVGTIVNDD